MLDFNTALQRIISRDSLSREEAKSAFSYLLDSTLAGEKSAAFLTALKMKGETAEEIAGFADCLNSQAKLVSTSLSDLIDICGTGGDQSGSFNVSTTVAFVLAAAGQPVAKHGNRSVSSKSGSFDLLEALGVKFCIDEICVHESLANYQLAFLYAPAFHPILKNLSQIRKSLGISTVLNILGPLLNPVIQVKKQILGVYSEDLVSKLAKVLLARGTTSAMVVHGSGKLDEFALSGPSKVAQIKNNDVIHYEFHPESVGIKLASHHDLRGGDPLENAHILISILKGERSPKRDIVLLNTSAALVVGGKAADFKEGVDRAAESIDSGRALKLLESMRAET